MEFAIFRTGGKQYKASVGDKVTIEKIEAKENQEIQIDDVLLVSDPKKGTIFTKQKQACVTIKLIETTPQKKIIVFKKKQRKNYRRKFGHKQIMSNAVITKIEIKSE